MKKVILIFFISVLVSFSKVGAQDSEAADEILFKIEKAGAALKEGKQLDQGDLSAIVCLTNIETKKGDGNYLGIIYSPSTSEIQLWRDWYEKNKTKISYSTSSDVFNKEFFDGKRKVIQVEYESGKFRNSVCSEDKSFQEWWPKWNTKN